VQLSGKPQQRLRLIDGPAHLLQQAGSDIEDLHEETEKRNDHNNRQEQAIYGIADDDNEVERVALNVLVFVAFLH